MHAMPQLIRTAGRRYTWNEAKKAQPQSHTQLTLRDAISQRICWYVRARIPVPAQLFFRSNFMLRALHMVANILEFIIILAENYIYWERENMSVLTL